MKETKVFTTDALESQLDHTFREYLYSKDIVEGHSVYILVSSEYKRITLTIDESTNSVEIDVIHPLVKTRLVFKLKEIDVIFGGSYIEFYESADRFIHISFDSNNLKQDDELPIRKKPRKKEESEMIPIEQEEKPKRTRKKSSSLF